MLLDLAFFGVNCHEEDKECPELIFVNQESSLDMEGEYRRYYQNGYKMTM